MTYKSKFEQIVEEQKAVLTNTIRQRYPRQIKFSEEFLEALAREYYTQVINEDSQSPVVNRSEKFLKALRFEMHELVQNQSERIRNYRVTSESTDDYKATSEHSPKQDGKNKVTDKEKNQVTDEVATDEMGKHKVEGAPEPKRDNKAIPQSEKGSKK